MPPRSYNKNFVSFVYLCYDRVRKSHSLETNELPDDGGGRFDAKFVFELEARNGCYDMGKFISSINKSKELSDLPADVFARWIKINHKHLEHLPENVWEPI